MSSNNNLLNSLEILKQKIINNEYTEFQKEDIFETIEAYNNQKWDVDPNLVKYLFRGWAVSNTPPLEGRRIGGRISRDDSEIETKYKNGKFYVGSVPKNLP